MSAYLQGLLLAGARREELAELKWEDVDFRWGSLWVKDKVAEEGRKIPLTPYFSSLLATLPRRNQWVFSSPAADNSRIYLAVALEEADLPGGREALLAALRHVAEAQGMAAPAFCAMVLGMAASASAPELVASENPQGEGGKMVSRKTGGGTHG